MVGRGTALYSSTTATLEGSEWSAARPDRTLTPGKTRYPFYRRLGGLQGRSGRAENLVPTGIRSRTVQPVVSRYTDSATRPIHHLQYLRQIKDVALSTRGEGGGVEVQFHSFLTLALDADEWSTSRPGRYTPGEYPRYPFSRRLCRPQSRSGRFSRRKNVLRLLRFEPQTVQPPGYSCPQFSKYQKSTIFFRVCLIQRKVHCAYLLVLDGSFSKNRMGRTDGRAL